MAGVPSSAAISAAVDGRTSVARLRPTISVLAELGPGSIGGITASPDDSDLGAELPTAADPRALNLRLGI